MIIMFRYLDLGERLAESERKNAALQALCEDLVDAVIELAEIITEEEKNG